MVKSKALPPRHEAVGFADWGIKRTIREAVNVSRWNPWLAHAWMEEARNQLSLDAPYFTEFDNAVDTINTYWKSLTRYRWYNQYEFWSIDGEIYEPQLLNYSTD